MAENIHLYQNAGFFSEFARVVMVVDVIRQFAYMDRKGKVVWVKK